MLTFVDDIEKRTRSQSGRMVSFTYDSLDRHVSTTLPNGSTITLERDIDGAILTRTVTGNAPEIVKYSTGVVQFYLSATKAVTGTTMTLPGGLSVTDSTGPQTATFTSLQGNACVTSSTAGTTRTRFDPFGTPLTALPDTRPGTSEAGFGDVAGVLTDTISPYGLIDMGARLYSTVLGRFLQVDPVPGGGVNAYVYPPDPVNTNDYSGMVFSADAVDGWRGDAKNWDGKGNARASARGMALTVDRRKKVRDTRQLIAVLGSISSIVSLFSIIPGGGWAVANIASFAISGIAVALACNGTLSQQECTDEKQAFVFSASLGLGMKVVPLLFRSKIARHGVDAFSTFSESMYGLIDTGVNYRNSQWSR